MEFKSEHPFCDGRFHRLLEAAGLLGRESGWEPFFIEGESSVLPGYIKNHSYGEYIFDWAWAEFYERHGAAYYPKIIHALPFTPINAPKVIGTDIEETLEKSKKFYLENKMISSQHFLFTNNTENKWLQGNDYLLKETLQYHFFNKYENFEDFLSFLKMRKRKNIKKERKAVKDAGLEIKWRKGSDIDEDLMKRIFNLYLSTIGKKQSYAYLNQNFFELLPHFMEDSLRIALAYKGEELIAMSLFIAGEESLYGRYWGIDPFYEKEFPFLHFELCYYLGMELCFEEKIPLFEAGAQGEHKLVRGFEPVVITSYHHLREKHFYQAIKEHLKDHNAHNREVISQFSQHLPYKN